MRVCIAHYHFRTGGVTSVVRNAAKALLSRGHDVCIVSGEEPASDTFSDDLSVLTVAGLGYADRMAQSEVACVVDKVLQSVDDCLGGEPDLWHIHNHSLGKGPALPSLVSELANRRKNLVLQLHDFAEDGRPVNYQRLSGWKTRNELPLSGRLYPQNSNIVYALLNRRDCGFLSEAGFGPVALLPNAVDDVQLSNVVPEGRKNMWVYPTRAIRRKNIGELLLHAALSSDDSTFAVTRAPQNPEQKAIYDDWVACAERYDLPVLFDYGSTEKSFENLMANSRGAVTTSVGEGFGLAYLEPWLFGTGLCGRDIPDITGDFKQDGIVLDHLYSRLDVPVEWIGEERLRSALQQGLSRFYEAYELEIPTDAVVRAFEAAVQNGSVDFGRLDEGMQRIVIERVCEDRACGCECDATGVARFGDIAAVDIDDNASAIRGLYNLEQYADRLELLYTQATTMRAEGMQCVRPENLLEQFMEPERFLFLRS